MVEINLSSETILPRSAIAEGFKKALNAAVDTLGATTPNPSVGCTLLDSRGTILAVGTHPKAGAPHAEIMALNAAREAGLYDKIYAALVTLEPCAHHGRTPPCAEALKKSPAQEIWIGIQDPNPQAMGGSDILRQGNSPKKIFFLEECAKYDPYFSAIFDQCQALALPFLTRIHKKRPWITVKQALTKEGSMIPQQGQKTFTSPPSLEQAHRLRKAVDVIITGVGTVIADHPSFSVRHVKDHTDRAPRLLIVMDRHDRLPTEWKRERERDHFIVKTCKSLQDLQDMLRDMAFNWALIEAGPTLLKTIKEDGFWDEWWVIQQQKRNEADVSTINMHNPAQQNVSALKYLISLGRN